MLLNLWTDVLGKDDYEHTAAPELLVNDGYIRHPTGKVGLRGARLVVCQETPEDGKLDEATVVVLTSNDLITARGIRQDFFTFPPTHKLVLSTNHKPQLRGTDHGIRRRIRLIPFSMKFWREADRELAPEGVYDPEFRADPGLEERLTTTEAAGILADMVEHARAFYAAGSRLDPPAEVIAATNEYLKDEDILGQFFEMMVKADPDGLVTASWFYYSFKKWVEEEGVDVKRLPTVTRFGTEAKKRYTHKRGLRAGSFTKFV